MQPDDSPRFFEALTTMSEFFADELSKVRQRTYWQHFEACTIEEWEYACDQAMQRETFHKVPLTASLMPYVKEYREAQRDDERRRERNQQAQRLLDAPAQQPASREEIHSEVQALLNELAETVAFPAPRREERAPAYRKPLAKEEYADRKARLLAQARQLEEQQRGQ
jgi:hypothetical protein